MAKQMAALVRTPDLTAVCQVTCYHPVGSSHWNKFGKNVRSLSHTRWIWQPWKMYFR